MKVALALVLSFVTSALVVSVWMRRSRAWPPASPPATPPAVVAAVAPAPEPARVITLDPILIVAPRAKAPSAAKSAAAPNVIELDELPLAPMKCRQWRPLEIGAGYVRTCE